MSLSAEILDLLPVACCYVAENGNIEYVNGSAKLLFKERIQLLGVNVWELFPASKSTEFHQALRDGQPIHFETAMPLSDIWINVDIYPDNKDGFSVFFRDISEQKHREGHDAFLSKINQDVDPLLTVHEVVNQLGERIVAYLHLSRCHFSIINEKRDNIEVIFEYSLNENSSTTVDLHHISDHFTQAGIKHFRAGKSALITAAAESPLLQPTAKLKQYSFLSFVEVPHLQAGEWKFLLSVGRAEVGPWRNDELDFLQELASSIYIRMERVRAQVAIREQEILYRLHLEKEVKQRTLELQTMISERKLAEQNMRVSEERLRMLVSASSDMVYVMNANWTKMYELRGKDFLADTEKPSSGWLKRYIPEQEQSRVLEAIGAAITGKHTFEFEHRVFSADGSIGWTYSRAIPILNQKGKITQWFGTAKDITHRKLSEEELAKNYTLLRHSEQLAGAGTWDNDLLNGNLSWSDGMYRLFGLEKGTKIKPEIYIKHALPGSLKLAEKVAHHLRTGSRGFEKTIEVQIGENVKVLKIKAIVVKDEQGQVTRMLGVDMDITAVRQAERLIRDMESRQQQEIFRVTLNTQEEERRRISESLHNGLGQLLYGIKMSTNRLNTELAIDNPEKFNDAKKYTTDLLTDAIKECRLLSHRLMPTVLGEFGLNAAINDICSQMRGSVTFHCQVKPDSIQLDTFLEIAVYRTVQELVINVVKHAQATVVSVEVIAENDEVLICVKDNGQGILEEKKEQPGIGLSSIRNKAAMLKGSVEITSSPGKGTKVEVRLPIYYITGE